MEKSYIAIDLKSFYASVECVQRGLDPLTTNLVVADAARTEKTICLALTPPLKKQLGLGGRARLFEVVQAARMVNAQRRVHAPGNIFSGKSCDAPSLQRDASLELDYLIAPPRMALYMQISTQIYHIYLQHIAPEDIHIYSIDEVFIDATPYLKTYQLTAREFAMKLILEILHQTGITATAGIGSNLYLCKIAMDIEAKHIPPDENGVRIAELDEISYRKSLWTHRPLTDFWRVGHGYAKKLEAHGLYTMGDIARCSIGGPGDALNEKLLYRLFGVAAELLIDHAWGWESCTLADIKAYRPAVHSLSSGQVLQEPYTFENARLVMREMTDLLSLDLVDQGLVTNQLVLTIGYDVDNLSDPSRRAAYTGQTTTDAFGRMLPKHAHGTVSLDTYTASTRRILAAMTELYDRIVDRNLHIRRICVVAGRVLSEQDAPSPTAIEQMDLFTDYAALQAKRNAENAAAQRERNMQQALLQIKKKYGKNAVLKGMNLQEGATAISRNHQIGGHKA